MKTPHPPLPFPSELDEEVAERPEEVGLTVSALPDGEPETLYGRLSATPKKTRAHKCDRKDGECRVHEIEGTAPGKWVQAVEGEAKCFKSDDSPTGFIRWQETGPCKTFSTQRHRLPAGARVSHVTTRFGLLPKDHGVVHWFEEDGHVVIRPAMDDHDLDLEAHLEDPDG